MNKELLEKDLDIDMFEDYCCDRTSQLSGDTHFERKDRYLLFPIDP